LGIGVLAKQDAYRGIKRETKAVPLLRFENEYLEFAGLGLKVKLPSLPLGEHSQIKFGIVGEFDLSGYKAKDAPILAGMAERKGGLLAGAKAEWENELSMSVPSGPPTCRATARATMYRIDDASLDAARCEQHPPGQADQGQPARGPVKHQPGDPGLHGQLLMNRILLVEDHERPARLVVWRHALQVLCGLSQSRQLGLELLTLAPHGHQIDLGLFLEGVDIAGGCSG
jgi:hypothetical protein